MTLFERWQGRVESEDFQPTWLAVFINPFYFARKGIRDYIKLFSGRLGGRLLDIGCGTKPYRDLFELVQEYIGMDHQEAAKSRLIHADVVYDGHRFPLPDESFDSALCTEVLEHVFNPDEFIAETRRVLKPGGRLLLTVPFVWEEHEQPYDFARYTRYGLTSLLEKHGFKVLDGGQTANGVRALCQIINASLSGRFLTTRWGESRWLLIPLIFPLNALGIVLNRILPPNRAFYLDNIILAEAVDVMP